ncbi:MAG: energy transducer TonB [Gemmatimonadales bacterium]
MRFTLRLTIFLLLLSLRPSIGGAQSQPAPADSSAATLPPLRLQSTSPRAEGDSGSRIVYLASQVDAPPELLQMPTPRPQGPSKGISETVTVRFIVGTDGRVEANSIQVVSATNQDFVTPVIQALQQAQFRPGQYHHQVVRTAVMQHFTYKGD